MERKPDLELKALKTFIGTQNYHNVMGVNVTDGVKYIMENGYSWFVTDAISLITAHPKVKEYLKTESFLVVRLDVDYENSEADLILEDGNDNEIYRQHYGFTDAKRSVTLYYCPPVLMLSSEY